MFLRAFSQNVGELLNFKLTCNGLEVHISSALQAQLHRGHCSQSSQAIRGIAVIAECLCLGIHAIRQMLHAPAGGALGVNLLDTILCLSEGSIITTQRGLPHQLILISTCPDSFAMFRNSDTFGIITLANMKMTGNLYGLGGTTQMLLTELANNPGLCGMVPATVRYARGYNPWKTGLGKPCPGATYPPVF